MALTSWSEPMATTTMLMTTTMMQMTTTTMLMTTMMMTMMMMMTMILWLADEILGSSRHQSDIHACAGNTACSFLPLFLQTSQNHPNSFLPPAPLITHACMSVSTNVYVLSQMDIRKKTFASSFHQRIF
jgi:hypothetical protein